VRAEAPDPQQQMDTQGRRALPTNRIAAGTVLLLVLSLGFCVWWFVAIFPWQSSIDYSRRPPEQVLRSIIGQPVPAGTADIRVAGRSYPFGLKHWVYVRFRASDAAIEELIAEREPVTGPSAREALRYPHPASRRYDSADQQRVSWQEVANISEPEVYSVSGGQSPFVWSGYLVVDRRSNLVYVGSNGD
jgi:hypothetical protein